MVALRKNTWEKASGYKARRGSWHQKLDTGSTIYKGSTDELKTHYTKDHVENIESQKIQTRRKMSQARYLTKDLVFRIYKTPSKLTNNSKKQYTSIVTKDMDILVKRFYRWQKRILKANDIESC